MDSKCQITGPAIKTLDSTKSAASDCWLSRCLAVSLLLQCEISWVTIPNGLITHQPKQTFLTYPRPVPGFFETADWWPSARSWHSRLWIGVPRCSMEGERERWLIPKLHLTFYDKQSLIYGNSANTDQERTIWKNSTPKLLPKVVLL